MSDWRLVYDTWDPSQQPLREALCTLGNGYFATRGAAEERSAGGSDYPGTYLAGGYDRQATRIAGRWVDNEDLVNWPNWLPLTFRPDNGDWLDLARSVVLDFKQILDVHDGVLERRVLLRDEGRRETLLVSRRLVHMASPHIAAICWELVPQNWSGRIHVRSALDGSVTNAGVARYRALESHHLTVLERGPVGEEAIYLLAEARQSKLRVAMAARTLAWSKGLPAAVARCTDQDEEQIAHELVFDVEEGHPVRVEKVVTLFTSRDHAISEPSHEAQRHVLAAPGFDALLASHRGAWRRLWSRFDMELQDGVETQRILRLHVFHLLASVSLNSIDLDVGVTARGLHGEAYRGHVFWDELFIFPLLNLRLPEITRALLMYRYRRLGEARRMAREAGLRGAMFPWQSGSNGREETQVMHLNPASGRWLPDETHLQRHVSSALAYNVWKYYEVTDDKEFLTTFGAEMIIEVARLWSSMATYDAHSGRFHIAGVVGPDEYHTRMPDAGEPGLTDNAYTNVMAAWVLRCAECVLDVLGAERRAELLNQLGVSDDEVARFREVATRLTVPFLDGTDDGGIIAQFEGWGKLEELDWERYRAQHGASMRLDRILEAEHDTPNRYKAAKQADVLMLFYLFTADELMALLAHMGYPYPAEAIPRTIDYYLLRTSHGSTLSGVVHSWVLSRSNREGSWQLFEQALRSDIADVQGGTTPEGIHLGAMAGTVDLIQRCYTGIDLREDILWLNPRLPPELAEIKLSVRYRTHWLALCFTRDAVRVTFQRGSSRPVQIGVRGEVYTFEPGDERTFAL